MTDPPLIDALQSDPRAIRFDQGKPRGCVVGCVVIAGALLVAMITGGTLAILLAKLIYAASGS